jgi:hypothetical protein
MKEEEKEEETPRTATLTVTLFPPGPYTIAGPSIPRSSI